MRYRTWIEKSRENRTFAEWCFENGHFNACANRMYYAMFHAAFAALLKYSITQPKDKFGHDWLQANFSQHLIRQRKVFPAKFRSSLSDAQKVRDNADYREFPIGKKFLSRELKKAQNFIKTIIGEITHENKF